MEGELKISLSELGTSLDTKNVRIERNRVRKWTSPSVQFGNWSQKMGNVFPSPPAYPTPSSPEPPSLSPFCAGWYDLPISSQFLLDFSFWLVTTFSNTISRLILSDFHTQVNEPSPLLTPVVISVTVFSAGHPTGLCPTQPASSHTPLPSSLSPMLGSHQNSRSISTTMASPLPNLSDTSSFFGNSFVKIQFISHTICPLKAYNSMLLVYSQCSAPIASYRTFHRLRRKAHALEYPQLTPPQDGSPGGFRPRRFSRCLTCGSQAKVKTLDLVPSLWLI